MCVDGKEKDAKNSWEGSELPVSGSNQADAAQRRLGGAVITEEHPQLRL